MNTSSIFSNASEDFVDEFASLTVSQYATAVFSPLVNKLDKEGASNVDQALVGAIQALQYGIMNAVIMHVTTFVLAKSTFVLTGIFLWIKGTHAVKKSKNVLSRILSNVGKKTGAFRVVKTVGDLVLGSEEQRLALAKMTNDTSNQVMTNVGQERQNQIMIHTANHKKREKVVDRAFSTRESSRSSNLEQHKVLIQTGGYTTSKKHKNVYEKATGQNLRSLGVNWNQNYVDKLNAHSEFAITAEGVILNNATATLNYMASQGWEAKKMSKLFYVTLNQGRTDNVYLYADSKEDILSFFNAVSTANVTIIKKVIYSKTHLVNTSGVRGFTPEPHNEEIKVMYSTYNYTDMLTIRFPKQNITNDFLISKMKQFLRYKNESIIDVLSIVKR